MKKGFTLIETIISIFVIVLLMAGVYALVDYFLKISADNRTYQEAIEIASSEMEKIRNLNYSDIGLIAGDPKGVVAEYKTIRKSAKYTARALINFYDDPYDGLAGGDEDEEDDDEDEDEEDDDEEDDDEEEDEEDDDEEEDDDDEDDDEGKKQKKDKIDQDYKIIEVKVSWTSKFGEKEARVFSKISP